MDTETPFQEDAEINSSSSFKTSHCNHGGSAQENNNQKMVVFRIKAKSDPNHTNIGRKKDKKLIAKLIIKNKISNILIIKGVAIIGRLEKRSRINSPWGS